MANTLSGALGAALAGLAALSCATANAAQLQTVTGFTNPGSLTMQKYVPDGMPSGAPIVVVMHGCTQNGADYFNDAGWKKMADQYKFAVLVPSQTTSNNFNKCFNWFEPGDYTRGQGESQSIVNAMNKVIADHGLDANRAFVSGLSAGGAFTMVMAGSYPDRFKGAAVMAGVVYGCGTDVWTGLSCMSYPGNDPVTLGNKVRNANPGYSGPWPRVQVFHGTDDDKVSIQNLTAIVNQWTNVHGIDQAADETGMLGNATVRKYRNGSGAVLVESYSVSAMAHAVAVDPGTAESQCGTAGQYYVDANLCSSHVALQAWGLASGGGGGGNSIVAGSVAGEDGYVKATASGGSPSVGSYSTPAIGRGADGKFNRSVLSFDTSAIPDGATIKRAYLTVTRDSSYGSPWTNPAGNQLVVDVKNGSFGNSTTETTDWAAAPTAPGVATIAQFSSASKASSDFSPAGLSAINKTGRTQIKLRFTLDQTSTNYLFIKEGGAATLTVEY
ncbi:Multifunctional esterase [Burkholderiaceae bacterium]|nr:Multifunctional esterase [Burkholderiaceae bacterium]